MVGACRRASRRSRPGRRCSPCASGTRAARASLHDDRTGPGHGSRVPVSRARRPAPPPPSGRSVRPAAVRERRRSVAVGRRAPGASVPRARSTRRRSSRSRAGRVDHDERRSSRRSGGRYATTRPRSLPPGARVARLERGQRASGGDQPAIARQDRVGSARWAATLRRRRVRRQRQPRTARREPATGLAGPGHRRASLVDRSHHGKSALACLAGGSMAWSFGTTMPGIPEFLPVVQERRPAQGQRQHGGRLGANRRRGSSVTGPARHDAAADRDCERDRRPPIRSEGRFAPVDGRAQGVPSTARESSSQSNTRCAVASARPPGRPSRRTARRPTSGRAARRRSRGTRRGGPAGPAGPCRRRGPGAPRRTSPGRSGLDGRSGMLQEVVEHVEPEPVDAALQPAPDHRAHVGRVPGDRQSRSGCCGRKVCW